jgi:SAM-dependent methyltransferase
MPAAAAWIAPTDEADRGVQMNAANIAAKRFGRDLGPVLEADASRDLAVAAGRETGLLLVPEIDRLLPEAGGGLALVREAQADGWRVMLLSCGIDSDTDTGREALHFLGDAPDPNAPAAVPLPEIDSPIPPAELRRWVSTGGEASFVSTGAMHVALYDASLAEAGAPVAEASDLLDWGAGCGRMTMHLLARAPRARITAADTDAAAIDWVRENLAVANAVTLPVQPPTDFADDAFDRVLGHSIFSHLESDLQDEWLAELARITRPGGTLAVSFLGPLGLKWHLDHPLAEVPDSVREATERDGIAIWRGDGWEEHFYDGYHTTFQTHEYVREHWSRWFDVVAIHAGRAAPLQDIAVLRPR